MRPVSPSLRCFVLASTLTLATPTALGQVTHTVPGDFATIQAAIDAANPLDTVLVDPGVYVETIDFLGKDLVVRSSAGAEMTTIDANGFGTVVAFENGETSAALLEGFTITGGVPEILSSFRGGGIHCDETSPTINECIITDNLGSPSRGAGGLHSDDGEPSVTNCMFSFNRGGFPTGAGAMFLGGTNSTAPYVADCDFISNQGGNRSLDSVHAVVNAGAGAVSTKSVSVVMERCFFRANRGGDGNGTAVNGGVGALYLTGHSFPVVRECQFVGNTGGDSLGGDHRDGGPGALYSFSRSLIESCEFRGNVGGSGGPLGFCEGGAGALWISLSGVPRPEVIGCTFEENRGGFGGDGEHDLGGAGAVRSNFTGTKFHNCTFEENIGGSAGTSVDDQAGPGAVHFARGGSNGQTLFARCFFYANQGGDGSGDGHGGAGAVFKEKSTNTPIMVGCVLAENVGGLAAPGAIECAEDLTVTNCTIVGNFGGLGAGGGIDLCGNANAVVTNTILWGNHGSGPGVDDNLNEVPGGNPGTFTYNLIEGGFAGVGNIDADPMFADASGRDFHVRCASPAREAGDNLAPWLSTLDFDGDARILDALVDIGVDEFDAVPTSTSYCAANPTSLGVSANIDAGDCNAISDGILPLRAEPVPNTLGLFFYGTTPVQLPFGNGFRCAGGSIFRLPSTNAAGNVLATDVDYTNQPNPAGEITAGSTWFFQAWFRDPAGGGSLFNLSDGLEVTFVD